MISLVTTEQIRNHEANFISSSDKNCSLELMEKAGIALAENILKYAEPYLFICGKGNNGGDGLVAARKLIEQNKKVFVFLLSNENSLSNDAKVNLKKLKEKNVIPEEIKEVNNDSFTKKLNSSNTIVDCILGTGVSGKLSLLYNFLIKTINESKKSIIACDIPTGVNPDTGAISENTIKASLTITFGFPKIGLHLYPAKEFVGRLVTIDIGLPELKSNYFLLDKTFIKEILPERSSNSNKGTFGKTLLVSGSKNYPGAALLSSKASAMIGSGLTVLSSPVDVFNQITKDIPEVIHIDFNLEKILKETQKTTCLVIGPGLGTEDHIKDLVVELIKKVTVPIVLDADGINVLQGKKEIIQKSNGNILITPHPKELSRLIGINMEELLNNKIKYATSVAEELNCTVVLKGAGSIIACNDKNVFISPFANSALAKGGTGDVLAGFIGGLISQGLSISNAACAGVYIHGKLGEIIANEKSEYCLLPQDLISYLPKAINNLLNINCAE